jgi:hypothetical protein
MAGIKHVAVIVAAIVWFALGAGWYTFLSAPWLAGIGKTAEQMTREGGGSAMPMIIGFVAILVMCYALAWLIGRLDARSLADGAVAGAIVALGFIGGMLALNYGFEGRSVTLWLINLGYALVGLIVAGGIIGAWSKST